MLKFYMLLNQAQEHGDLNLWIPIMMYVLFMHIIKIVELLEKKKTGIELRLEPKIVEINNFLEK